MTNYVGNLDGGMTSVVGHNRRLRTIMSADGVVIGATDLKVTEQDTPSATVDVAVGDIFLFNSDYVLHGWTTAINELLVASNSSGNGRIDAVVAYIDLAAYTAGSSNNPAALVIDIIDGTPDVSPVAPSDVTIQAAVGASNPFLRLANIVVDDSFTTIVDADITDTREVATYSFARVAAIVLANAGTISSLDTAGTSRTLVKFNANNVLELASKTAVVNQGYLTDTGAANAYVVTATPAPLAYETGMEIIFKAVNASTSTSTINVNALGTKTIKKNGTSNLSTGDIIASGIYKIIYDGTDFQFCGPVGGSGGSAYSAPTLLTDGATVTIDHSLNTKFYVTLGGNRTFAISNATVGKPVLLDIIQDGTGSRTVTWFPTVADTVTMTIATPCVVTTTKDIPTCTPIVLTTTGALPTGLTASTRYYWVRTGATTGNLATSIANAQAGTVIATTGSQSGTHTMSVQIRWGTNDVIPTLSTGKYRRDTFGLMPVDATNGVWMGCIVNLNW